MHLPITKILENGIMPFFFFLIYNNFLVYAFVDHQNTWKWNKAYH